MQDGSQMTTPHILVYITDMLSNLGWRSLENRRTGTRLAMFYKIVYGLIAIPHPSYFDTLATCTLFLTDRFTHLPVTINTHFPISIVLWIKLPADLVLVPNLDSLKHESFFLSFNTGTIKLLSLRQGVRFWNFEEKNKKKHKKKLKSFGCVFN